ncbi:MAG: FHA domain-containing protein [Anaerolineaceae bacterium]|jgi:predicted component of type VI protein secretion system|nr:MAG: FHA domain-containing protein [Anaerolineaceae bacterium]
MIEEDEMALICKLIMKSGPEVEKIYRLEKDEYVIGRELINDLIISDPEISRRHARIFKKNDRYFLEDLNSTNGTFYSGKRIGKPVQLKNGDLINLGQSIVFEFVMEEIGDLTAVEKEVEKKVEKQEGTKEIKKASAEDKSAPVKPIEKAEKPVRTGKKSDAPFGIEKLRNTPTWLIVLIIVLLFLIVFCVLPMLIVEWTNQWCNFFGTFFNQIQPGVCP